MSPASTKNGDVACSCIDKQRNVFLVLADFRDRAFVSLEDTGDHRDFVPHLKAEFFFVDFHIELFDLFVGERDGSGPGADKTGDTGNVSDHMPGFIGHRHLHEHISGEELDLHLFLFALFIDDRLHSCGDLDVINEMGEMAVLDDFFEIGFDFVLKTGVGMDDIPFGTLVEFVEVTHGLAYQSGYAFDDLTEHGVNDGNREAEHNDGANDEQRILSDIFPGHPRDLFEFAQIFFPELLDASAHTDKNVRLFVFHLCLFVFGFSGTGGFSGRGFRCGDFFGCFFFDISHFVHLSSLRLSVQSVLPAEAAELLHFEPVRIVFLVFCCVIISGFALGAGQRNFDSHIGTS